MQKFVKFCAVFLCAALIFATALYNPLGSITASAETLYGYIDATNVRIRTGPGTEYDIIGKLSNVQVTVLGSARSASGELWYNIQHESVGTGYIIEDYIEIFSRPTVSGDFAQQLASFPESYHAGLTAIHAMFPNYTFIADRVNIPFYDAVYNQTLGHRKLVNMSSDGVSWRALGPENYNWSTGAWNTYSGNWTDASKEVIAYYMDPRNFLNVSSIYMFAQQSFNTNQTEQGIAQIVKGTYLEQTYSDPNDTAYNGSYVKVIMEAGRQANVNPYVLASTLILEQGVAGTSALISGESGYYNFFNYKASGDDVIGNGLAYAKEMGWDTRSKSIIGGAKLYADGYIAKGQDTYYYKDFDILDSQPYTHQYAQSIYDARSSSVRLREYYSDKRDLPLTFRIPVYADMPATPPSQPPETDSLNNYYFTSIAVGGLSPAFSMYTQSYSLSVYGDTSVSIAVPSGASYAGAASFDLAAGQNTVTLPVKAQTGYLNYYTIYVTAAAACKLTVTTDRPAVVVGDINSDGTINTADLAAVRMHMLGIRTLSSNEFLAADINSDGTINTADLAGIRLHLLGLRPLM